MQPCSNIRAYIPCKPISVLTCHDELLHISMDKLTDRYKPPSPDQCMATAYIPWRLAKHTHNKMKSTLLTSCYCLNVAVSKLQNLYHEG